MIRTRHGLCFPSVGEIDVEQFAEAMEIKVSSPGGWDYPEAQVSAKTEQRIKRAAARFGENAFRNMFLTWYRPRPVIRLRMVVKDGQHVGYQRLNEDHSIHSYTWF